MNRLYKDHRVKRVVVQGLGVVIIGSLYVVRLAATKAAIDYHLAFVCVDKSSVNEQLRSSQALAVLLGAVSCGAFLV